MAYGINGTLEIGIDPTNSDYGSNNRERSWSGSYTFMTSVNQPIVISAIWNDGQYENQEPLASNAVSSGGNIYGDVVNVIFDVYQVAESRGISFPSDWTLVGSIRKSRDIRNISQMDRLKGGDGVVVALGHTFTVDISEMCRDLLTYSLVPHGKGTWTSSPYGGLNGGAEEQGNLIKPVWNDIFLPTKNGSYRQIKVRVRCEIINGEGLIREATKSGSFKDIRQELTIINSALDYDGSFPPSIRGGDWMFGHSGWGTDNLNFRTFMTTYRANGYWSGSGYQAKRGAKSMRLDEAAEFIQWLQRDSNNYPLYFSGSGAGETPYGSGNTSDLAADIYVRVSRFDHDFSLIDYAYLYDFNQNLVPKETINGVTNVWPRYQHRMCSQNISPVYINANCIHQNSTVKDIWENGGTPYTRYVIDTLGGALDSTSLFLNDSVGYYGIQVMNKTTTQGNGTGVEKRLSETRYYKLDRDRWLNTAAANSADNYAGITYTEIKATTPSIRCKGLRWVIPNETTYFRVHWLNKCGAIDSYTIKGHKTVSYNSEKDIIQRKEPDRFDTRHGVSQTTTPSPYPSNNAPTTGNYKSDYMGNSMNHKGGLEVLNVNATKSGTVTTLPLAEDKADWLREILTSPNVWTEHLTQDVGTTTEGVWGRYVNYRSYSSISTGTNMDGRTPNNMEYVPLIITNSSIDVFDESKGLVTITFEYTHSHAVVTQRN